MLQQWQIDNAAYIYRFFTSRGFTPESTCGMLGNIQAESAICSWRIENKPLTSTPTREYIKGVGYGLVQWTESQYDVELGLPFKIVEWCNQRGLPYWTVESQCEYLYYQMTNPAGQYFIETNTAWTPYGEVYPLTQEEYRVSRKSAGYLALAFCANFERPNPSWRGGYPHYAERSSYANAWYSQLASASIPSSTPQPAPAPVDNPPSSYDGSYYPPASPDGRYQIQPGNTLSGIAEHFGVTVQDLCQWNGISDPNTIYAWHYIYVKPHNPSPAPAGGRKIVITIASGDTLWGIAQEYGVTVQQLCQWNNIKDPNYIRAGASLTIYLPSSSPSPSYIIYTVQKGDTLWGIAQRYGVTVQDLCEWNRNVISDPNDIYPRERLIIYTGASSPSGPTGWYTVRKGDTLWGIAQMYGVTVQDLCEWNRGVILDPNKIYPNTTIRV